MKWLACVLASLLLAGCAGEGYEPVLSILPTPTPTIAAALTPAIAYDGLQDDPRVETVELLVNGCLNALYALEMDGFSGDVPRDLALMTLAFVTRDLGEEASDAATLYGQIFTGEMPGEWASDPLPQIGDKGVDFITRALQPGEGEDEWILTGSILRFNPEGEDTLVNEADVLLLYDHNALFTYHIMGIILYEMPGNGG